MFLSFLLKEKNIFQTSLSHAMGPWLWGRKQTCELTLLLSYSL